MPFYDSCNFQIEHGSKKKRVGKVLYLRTKFIVNIFASKQSLGTATELNNRCPVPHNPNILPVSVQFPSPGPLLEHSLK